VVEGVDVIDGPLDTRLGAWLAMAGNTMSSPGIVLLPTATTMY
jgi:hypothetical protein